MSRELLKECMTMLIKHESIIDSMPDDKHFELLKKINEYLAKQLPEPVVFDERMLQHFTCEKAEQQLEGVETPFVLYHTKMGAHQTYQLYKNEAAALWRNLGKALGYAEPPEQKPLSDDEINQGMAENFIIAQEAFRLGIKFAEKKHGITDTEQSKPQSNAI